ncbi:MAG: ABC transporter permease [Polyangiales bacterium]
MRLRPIAGLLLRQLYLLRGSPTRILPLFAWVAIDVVLWGFIARYLQRVGPASIDFSAQLVGAVLFWDFFVRVKQGVIMSFFEDVWSRNFINVFATPLTVGEYLAGLVLTSIGTGAVGLGAMLLLAGTLFSLPWFGLGVAVLPALLVMFTFGAALGVVASALVLRYGPTAEWLVWPLPALLAPFAGVFYPLATLPNWMQTVARALPPSYVFEAMRAVLTGGTPSWSALALAAAIAVAEVGAACWVFTRVYRYAVRKGLLARYSAESVT